MFITDKVKLEQYSSKHRLWQGIPGIEVTKNGRIFSTFYSGGTTEDDGNFALLVCSDDGGKSFSEPIAVAHNKAGRCYDPVLWIDPLGRLWFTWGFASLTEERGVYGVICNEPDAKELVWSDVFLLGKYVMMNKPTVLSTGEWLFPIAVWNPEIRLACIPPKEQETEETGAFVYSYLQGRKPSFKKLGGVCAEERSFDEHMVVELKNAKLMMLIRTTYGIAVSYSYNQGQTWTTAVDSKIGGPSSRFFIKRLPSGRILLVNHYKFSGRNNLTALLSEDEGKTWKYSLLLDERANVSYPDATITNDGYIYVTYDRERGAYKNNLGDVLSSAREILFAKITEEDIIAGKLVNKNSVLKVVISKLSEYVDDDNPFNEIGRYSDVALAEMLCNKYSDKKEALNVIFDYYPIACENMCELDTKKLDDLFAKLDNNKIEAFSIILEAIKLVRAVSIQKANQTPIVDRVEAFLIENVSNNPSISDIARSLNISTYYLMHTFKKQTGITVGDLKTSLQLSKAKVLLREKQKSITEISSLCGFENSDYFSRVFKKEMGISPTQYREKSI